MILLTTHRTCRIRRTLLLVSSCFALCGPCLADDWPQFRGPLRDGVSRETNLLKSWPEGEPRRLWLSTNLGADYSSPAIVREKIYIMGQRTDAQWLLCLDAKDGKELWSTRLGDPYTNEFGDGPRGTPTVRDSLIFALGANGELLCVEPATGKEVGWVCQNWLTGDEVWSSKALDKGTVTIADGMMYCITEDNGTVVLAQATPVGWKEHSRFVLAPQSERRPLKAKVWTPPVIAHGRLYLRDQENLWCFGIFLGTAPSRSANSRQP